MAASDFTTWAILDALDQPICEYVGITECSVAYSAQVLSEPLEGGEIAAYNKVQAPDVVTLSLAISSDPSIQSAALADLKALKEAIGRSSLCKLVTPFFVIDNLALETISQARSVARNATSLVCELSFLRIRIVQTGSQRVAWSPKNATSADATNSGRVQGQTTLRKLLN